MSIFDILSKPIASVGGSKSIFPQQKTSTPAMILPKEAPASTTLPQAKPSVALPQQKNVDFLSLISKPIAQVATPAAPSSLPKSKGVIPMADPAPVAPIVPERSFLDVLRKPINTVVRAENDVAPQDTSLLGPDKPLRVALDTVTGLPKAALKVSNALVAKPSEVRLPFNKDTEKTKLPYGGLLLQGAVEVPSRIIEIIPKVIAKSVINFGEQGKMAVAGDTAEKGVDLGFDPSRLGIQKTEDGNARSSGFEYIKHPWVQEYLDNPASFGNLSKASAAAILTVGQDMLDAIGAGQIASAISKKIAASIPVPDDELVTAWNGLGKPATVQEAQRSARKLLLDLSKETKGFSQGGDDVASTIITYKEALEANGIPKFPSAFSQGARRAAEALNTPVEEVWATLKGTSNQTPFLGVKGLLADGKTNPKVASIAEDHLSEARDVVKTLPKAELDALGGPQALVANTKRNIVDGLKAGGFADDAARIEAINTSAIASIDDLEKAIGVSKGTPITGAVVPSANKEIIEATAASKALGAVAPEARAAAVIPEAPIEVPGAGAIAPRAEVPTFAKRAPGGSPAVQTTETPATAQAPRETAVSAVQEGIKASYRSLQDLYRELGDRKPTPAQMQIQAEATAAASDFSNNLITKADFDAQMATLKTRLEATLADRSGIPMSTRQPEKSPVIAPENYDRYTPNLTVQEARQAIESLFTPEEVKVFFDPTLLADTKNLGYYSPSGRMPSSGLRRNAVIRLYETGGKVSDRVVYHESFHAYFNEFVPAAERAAILQAVKNNPLTVARSLYSKEAYPTADARAEEWLADDFARYVRGPQKYKGMFRDLWERLLNQIRSLIRRASRADKVYRDILNKKRPAKAEPSGLPKRKAFGPETPQGKEITKLTKDIQGAYAKAGASAEAGFTKAQEVLSGIMAELELSTPGSRIFINGEVRGISSTFPEWVPSELRSRDLFDKVIKGLDPENMVFPSGP
ncbi:MAG: hypothetical protein WC767_03780, partial [Candidatus Paceibacterota bacterium]